MEEFKAFVRELLVGQIPFILKLHAFQMVMSENEFNRPFPSSKNSHFQIEAIRDCAIIIRRGGAEKLELSSKNLDSTPPPKQKKIVLTPPLLC